ncbi:MAG: hypothetical protein WA110_06140, partial [Anaerolineaceae bacterium]
MKNFFLASLLLVLIFLSGCSQHTYECHNGVCIKAEVVEPIILEEPIALKITVETDEAVQGLDVNLYYDFATLLLEETKVEQGWQVSRHENNVIIWTGDTAAHEPAVFQTKIVLPSVDEGGVITIRASAYTELTGEAVDMFGIYFTNKEGEVYYLGTPLPITRTSNYPTPDPLTTLTTTLWPTSATETIIPTPPPAATQQ